MKLDDIIKVAAEYPFKTLSENIELQDDMLSIEQLPQLLTIGGVKRVKWKYKAKILGPDLSTILTEGTENEEELIIRTPLHKVSIPWIFTRLDTDSLKKLVEYLIPCKEGISLFNISPWPRYYFMQNRIIELKEGEIGNGRNVSLENIKLTENQISINTRFVNPKFFYMNPYYIESSYNPIRNTFAASLELTEAYSFVSNSLMDLEFELGKISVEANGKILVSKTRTFTESKLHRLLWDMTNDVIEIECNPQFPLSLYRIEPSSIIPLYMKFDEKTNILQIVLENFSDKPVIATVYISARITKILKPNNTLTTEYDRVKIPIRRWGIINLELEIKKLPDLLLKRKAI
ncbi:hypothetical protein SULI_09775 [Saccharolobus solfataricus]|uniref:Uncharacterized protein n=3 Tax=Saccharolobus solfataricus TaxID=2287 RepID=Q97ZH7_SACS2|nr:hypothetical protein [Saccharolobus solfataricus]AAK41211.1 Hypothetical protein SSO0934 [Saccharolobus solfataricus P2]AKA74162.1 hypothetical protein SULB_1944 [Saccharolobus solfataricus]AKA76860.1 hypothetical protein SULC_1942 [Saccharolobus solfataricus]AKA79553.1 hypothetical protein SULA_1943 [Saccharolobus solfataricus]AZF68641.1 hypothetical protein SULG_09775 [Saccharolobus solfataricus]